MHCPLVANQKTRWSIDILIAQTSNNLLYIFEGIPIVYKTFSKGTFSKGTFSKGTFRKGTFSKGTFTKGTFSKDDRYILFKIKISK